MTTLPTKVLLSEDALFQEMDGEAVILDLRSSSYFGLDEIGTRFWQLLQSNADVQHACDTLLDEYQVDKNQLESDVQELIAQLVAAELVNIEQHGG